MQTKTIENSITNKLLVIISDRLSEILEKGEVIDRYYNPGNLFQEVHIIMTNNDQPVAEKVQKMVGNAKLYLYNFPYPPHVFRNTLGLQFPLLKKWTIECLKIARDINPSLIRVHNNFLEGYLAHALKTALKIPYVISLHGVWDIDHVNTWKEKIYRFFRKKIEIISLKNADAVLCVYSTIINYAQRHGAKNPLLLHNFVSQTNLQPKNSWMLSEPVHLITVNRQLPEKDPSNIIKAIAKLPFPVQYSLIGDGVLHESLKSLAKSLDIQNNIHFLKSLPNEEVCKLYHQADILVSNCNYKGISKTIIEAGLTKLPIIINQYEDGFQLPEYSGNWLLQCSNTPEGYAEAITKLVQNHAYRAQLGQNAYQYTHEHFSPTALEQKVTEIYKNLVNV